VYKITTDERSSAQIAALRADDLVSYAEIMAVLELVPWQGEPTNAENPDGPVRALCFGNGSMVTYLILEDQLRVDVVDISWIGR
jgi:hypothetical protein